MNQPNSYYKTRDPRYDSKVLVEVRKYKNVPFGVYTGALIDLSRNGLKVAFAQELGVKIDQLYWVHIPLSLLGSHGNLLLQVKCLWYDEVNFKMGVSFLNLSQEQESAILELITCLHDLGKLIY